MNQAKLAKLQAQVRVGGKGTPRRKKGAASKGPQSNDKEIMNEMRKQQLRQLGYVEEGMFI
jgi:nascent polypeptide-associated complex subunit beta